MNFKKIPEPPRRQARQEKQNLDRQAKSIFALPFLGVLGALAVEPLFLK